MREVMQKAQELAESILDSEIYQTVKRLEGEVRHDEEAARLMGDMIACRQNVENILSASDMDPEQLKAAGEAMEEAEKTFERFQKCTEIYKKEADQGKSLEELIVVEPVNER